MKEMNERELLNVLQRRGEPLVVFFYTPLCGTCKVARRMLEVAEHLLPSELVIVSADVNSMRGIVNQYRISSVPALLVATADPDAEPAVYYSMGSVERILEYIRSVTS